MRLFINSIIFLLLIILSNSCSTSNTSLDDKYQPIGTAVLAANDLLLVKYSENSFITITGENYKELLKENYLEMYENILPYSISIEKTDSLFKVSVKDGDRLILTDWLCTEGKIDCWSYNGECQPDTLQVQCD